MEHMRMVLDRSSAHLRASLGGLPALLIGQPVQNGGTLYLILYPIAGQGLMASSYSLSYCSPRCHGFILFFILLFSMVSWRHSLTLIAPCSHPHPGLTQARIMCDAGDTCARTAIRDLSDAIKMCHACRIRPQHNKGLAIVTGFLG